MEQNYVIVRNCLLPLQNGGAHHFPNKFSLREEFPGTRGLGRCNPNQETIMAFCQESPSATSVSGNCWETP
jgi:hypothetical protein